MEIGGGPGRVFVDWHKYRYSGKRGRHQAEISGSGWHWKTDSNRYVWDDRDFFSSCGPVHWHFEEYQSMSFGAVEWRYVNAPYWFVFLASGAWPTISLARMLRRRARTWKPDRAGRCLACGYDLRATPDRCPECGMTPEASEGSRG
jgi:hypothetical protein